MIPIYQDVKHFNLYAKESPKKDDDDTKKTTIQNKDELFKYLLDNKFDLISKDWANRG